MEDRADFFVLRKTRKKYLMRPRYIHYLQMCLGKGFCQKVAGISADPIKYGAATMTEQSYRKFNRFLNILPEQLFCDLFECLKHIYIDEKRFKKIRKKVLSHFPDSQLPKRQDRPVYNRRGKGL